MTGELDADPRTGDPDTDPNDRVHHHARLEGGRRSIEAGPIRTLCGLLLGSGPRPGAAALPCCPMCAAEMHAVGRRCGQDQG